ncbi:adenylate kinase superfamily protein [Besnoitia besnoiti]|uniref:Adenylate kinase superfamily protein n=1 Tax=Besnoitia besnoiti TaxID=94643 RepID=A0A2A9M7V1_BESBE|nr:adenylate kinase superfamily protein [Besnoitia besnoiti]PFH33254.1 adenylate kinase superfamily protein [Besnoitia besnoiti]
MSPLRAFLPHPAAEMVSLEAARERGAHTPCACSPSHSPADSRGSAPSRRASLSRAAPCAASPSSVSSVSSAVSAPVSLASGGGAASASACPLPAPLARPPHPLILLCGPPCSGKGSLATLLCRRLAFSHVSTGDLLRRFLQRRSARAQTEDARERAGEGKAAGAEDAASKKSRDDESSHADEASRALQSGGLVSDALIVQLLHREMERLSRRHAKEEEEPSHAAPEERGRARGYRGGVVLEGFPRSAEQVDMLYAINCTPDAVVCLDVKDTVLFQRMGGRLIDPETAQVYGAANPPPAAILHRLVRRDDDKQDVLENRIELYRRSWRDISRRLRSHSQWRALQQEERALYRAGRTPEDLGGHTLVEERERRSVERLQDATLHAAVEALERKDAEGKTTGEVGEEEPHEDIGIIDGSRHIEDVYGDVLVFLRKKFGDKIEEQTLQTPAS